MGCGFEVPPRRAPADDAGYLEQLTKAIFQAGFSWPVIRDKWPRFRRAFEGFDIARVAAYGRADVERLLSDGADAPLPSPGADGRLLLPRTWSAVLLPRASPRGTLRRRGCSGRKLGTLCQGFRTLKVRDVIRMIEEDGWYLVAIRGSHRQYRHPTQAWSGHHCRPPQP